ncbi:BgTH12-07628 [Blumeria graminis f. sp. triticale]|uniref:Bgt-5043 n=3 Tax=Blumeria graminis TaxID=34373 RepID=A0A381LGX6_BLUGR|nr:Subunit of the Nup84p subcomplex of the nuclear pore complex NPC [Blumeria graminis f. sp. tritici 96224]CAD6500451.1 BgTH12-07628 [Blumeria graminis f. sp. triticale]VCU40719.1 Bgt-5043 [Blumeria graminis f. sp. tritici]
MFKSAHDAAAQHLDHRTSRRRQRPLSSELSLSEPKSKRRRSGLINQTSLTSNLTPETEEKNIKLAALQFIKDGTAPMKELTVRGKRPKSRDRCHRGDGSTILASNDIYTVSKLPAFPDRLRLETDKSNQQHGSIGSTIGYALILTCTHAIVWPYSTNLASPETFVFDLNISSKHNIDFLPIGTLVSASASSTNPGLVVIIPTTGMVTYWESISCAATLELGLRRNGVELTIPGLASGEIVTQLVNAESAGFFLAFSSGRTAYMSVRDGQGRPAISVQFIKNGINSNRGGLFNSIRNVLSTSSLLGDISAVRAGLIEKIGERDVVVATARGRIQCLRIHRGGHVHHIVEVESREPLFQSFRESYPDIIDASSESFELLDFTFIPCLKKVSNPSKEEDNISLLLLYLLNNSGTKYILARANIQRNELKISSLRIIKSYASPVKSTAVSRPRLYLPKPSCIAYIVFHQAVVMFSTFQLLGSIDSLPQSDENTFIQNFDDTIDFRNDQKDEIIGSEVEEFDYLPSIYEETKSPLSSVKIPALLLLVRGTGVIRISTVDLKKLIESKGQAPSAKTKLEQAVFFGSMEKNPLNFAVRPEQQFTYKEFGEAALRLSEDILGSKCKYLSSVAASIDQNFQKRSTAMRELACYLQKNKIELDRVTKWKLLCDAERLRAATLGWKSHEAFMRSKSLGNKRGLVLEIVESMHENLKTEPDEELGESDRVRSWFLKDLVNIESALPWAYQCVKIIWEAGSRDPESILQLLYEANNFVAAILKGAFEFRTANLGLYGLSFEQLNDGILTKGYEGLPEFWTSTFYITENLDKQSRLATILTSQLWCDQEAKFKNRELLENTRRDLYSLFDVMILSKTERIRWLSAQQDPVLQRKAEDMKESQQKCENECISALASSLELPDEAIDLAERHQILTALASILKLDLEACRHSIKKAYSAQDLEVFRDRKIFIEDRMNHLFVKFGMRWATALWENYLARGAVDELLDSWPEQQTYLTSFLRSKNEYTKISWINDVTREKDLCHASKSLIRLGTQQDQDLWSKKIILSIGKLALSAVETHNDAGTKASHLALTNQQLGLTRIQEAIYNSILPAIDSAIDDNAEVHLLLESYGNEALEKQPKFKSQLVKGFSSLIKHETMSALDLVDLLTLMDTGHYQEGGPLLRTQQFYLALKAASLGPLKIDQNLTQRIIWRRCMLRDNWAEINNTDMKDDDEVMAQSRATTLYQTLITCFEFRLFDKGSDIKPISPCEVLGAGLEGLDERFTRLDNSLREDIMREMQIEDDALRRLIETSRFDQWHATVLELAQHDRDQEKEEKIKDKQRIQDASEELTRMEGIIRENEKKKAENLLYAKSRPKSKTKPSISTSNISQIIQKY